MTNDKKGFNASCLQREWIWNLCTELSPRGPVKQTTKTRDMHQTRDMHRHPLETCIATHAGHTSEQAWVSPQQAGDSGFGVRIALEVVCFIAIEGCMAHGA